MIRRSIAALVVYATRAAARYAVTMADSETMIVARTLQAIGSLPGVLAWRNNSGALVDRYGRLVRFGAVGSPDILAIVDGLFVGLEVKRQGGRMAPQQRKWKAACERAGGVYVVIDDPAQALAVVDAIRGGEHETAQA